MDVKGNFVFPPTPSIYVVYVHNQESARKILRSRQGGLYHLPPKYEHIFVAIIGFNPFLLCRYT